MSDRLLKIYHCLPVPLRSVAASLHGLYLSYSRYGSETEGLIEEALGRESWSSRQWRDWQEERLARVLHRAATQVPYYREQWAARRRHGDRRSWEYLENWPVLKKEPLRQNPLAFVADDRNVKRMYLEHTSGTTGTPLKLWMSRETLRALYALFEARVRRWHGVSFNDRWAILGGRPVIPAHSKHAPFWVYNAPMNQLYLSANHLSARNIEAYVDALKRYRVTHMIVYPSSASVLSREVLNAGLGQVGVKLVITNAELVYPWQRDIISEALGAQVRETYGMTEIVAFASECQAGNLHLWPEIGWLEIFSDTEDVAITAPSSGRLICTGLLNQDMPLIRYEVGDRGSMPTDLGACRCGRTLPAMSIIEGRTSDLLVTKDGRHVFWLNPVFYGLPVREAQVIQEALDCVRVRYVPTADFRPDHEIAIIQRLKARMGSVEVIMEPVGEVPREPNGKFRPVIRNLPKEQEEFARGTEKFTQRFPRLASSKQ